MSRQPIAEYALLSDCRSAALVHRSGSVDWLCLPRYDAPSVFGRLLDERAGHWSIGVPRSTALHRRYLDGTLVLETKHETPTGRLTLTEALAVGANERDHRLAVQSPHVLLRRAECTVGSFDLEMEYAPRPDYGRAGAGPNGDSGLVFSSPVAHADEGGTARARV